MITSPCCICHEPMNTNTAVGINGEGVAHPACHSAREAARLTEEVAADMERMKRVSRDLRQCSECPNCRWPMPPDNDHDICECCSFQVSYNVVEGYLWDGTWWFKDGRPPEIVERLQARAEAAEGSLAQQRETWKRERQIEDNLAADWQERARTAEAALALREQEADELLKRTVTTWAETYRVACEDREDLRAALALQAQEVEKLKTQWREQAMDGHYHSFIRATLKNCIGDLEQALPSAAAPVKEPE